MSFIRNYWWATLFGVILLVWTWRTWRRVVRLSASTGARDDPASGTRNQEPALLRRVDVESACQELRRREPPLLAVVRAPAAAERPCACERVAHTLSAVC